MNIKGLFLEISSHLFEKNFRGVLSSRLKNVSDEEFFHVYAKLVALTDHKTDFINTEIRNLKEDAERWQEMTKILRDKIKRKLNKNEQTTYKDDEINIRLMGGKLVCKISSVEDIPFEYKTINTKVLKDKIIKHFKDTGNVVAGVKLEPSKEILQIRVK